MLKVSCDRNVNIKVLRQLELLGKIEVHGVAIEGHEDNRKLSNKTLASAFVGSLFATIGNCKIVPNETPKKEIEEIIGSQHHGDVLHFLDHLLSERDVFVTDDNDFLSKRTALEERFRTKVRTAAELVAMVKGA
jgi:hypothetical protein